MITKLVEDTKNQLISKQKSAPKGLWRFNRRNNSKVKNYVREMNNIDMNNLFKNGIFSINIPVKGETDDYFVRISFGGFLEVLHDQLKRFNNELDLRVIIKTLQICYNRDDVFIHCSCPDWQYRYSYWATKGKLNSGNPEIRPSNITNPNNNIGVGCKHVMLVLNNYSWLIRCASVIWNYIKFMEKNQKRLFAEVIYPAIFQKKYEYSYQLSIFDKDNTQLPSDKDTIDTANKQGADDTRFKKGNTQGVRFASNGAKDDNQIKMNIDDKE